MSDASIEAAALAVREADALLFTAGAGMGVDSGLPDFRGTEGFWRAYPPFRALGMSFADAANPEWFKRDPHLAWGFYGHRLALYRKTKPHAGFETLRAWGESKAAYFVFTSNVDGAFQRAGFDPEKIVECHGAIDFVQCTIPGCKLGIVPADPYSIDVDPETFRARGELPKCPSCGAMLRPNVLMFGDWGWSSARSDRQEARLEAWMGEIAASDRKLTIVECGAGTAIPTVRSLGERFARRGATLVRINVREPEVPGGGIGLAMGALAAIGAIDEALKR